MVLIMNEIKELLNETKEAGSQNQLLVENVKGWIKEYLEMYSEEMSQYPEQKSVHHWDLIAADYDITKDAHFLVAYFHGESVTFLAGRGPVPDVRGFATDTFPENPDEVTHELMRKFMTGTPWTVSIDRIVTWIQR